MFSQSSLFATVWFVTAVRGQSSPGGSLDSSSTTAIDGTNPVTTQPSSEVNFSWLPVSTLYSSVDLDDYSTVSPAVVATYMASGTVAASSTETSLPYADIASDSSSTSFVPVVESVFAAAASTYATSDAQDMTSQTSLENTMTGDMQQPTTSTDAVADLPTSTAVDGPGLATDPNSSALPASTLATMISSTMPASSAMSSPISAPVPPSSTESPATAASSLVSPGPQTVTQIITSFQPTTIVSIQPTTVLSTPATTLATSVVVASTSVSPIGMDCPKHSKDCHKDPKKQNIICNTTGDKEKTLLICDSLAGGVWWLQDCRKHCSCKDGALNCEGMADNTLCNATAVIGACNCHWNVDTQACDSGTTNNWKLGGCACPPNGQEWS